MQVEGNLLSYLFKNSSDYDVESIFYLGGTIFLSLLLLKIKKGAKVSVRKVVWKNVYNLSFWDVTPSSKNKYIFTTTAETLVLFIKKKGILFTINCEIVLALDPMIS